MGLFDKIKEPVFIKESSVAATQLAELQKLVESAPLEVKAQIEQDIKILNAGIIGENNIIFELKNSHIPMFVLHDLYLTYGDLSAQIDFLIVTRKRTFVVECKNLIGDIEINSNGDFIRTISYNGKLKKEGLYSPITQNQRHLDLIKQIRRESKNNILVKTLFDRNFNDNYRSVVVLANPKTVLNDKYAKKEVKQKVIRADRLIEFIKKTNDEPGIDQSSEQQMEELARFYFDQNREYPMNLVDKYTELTKANPEEAAKITVKNEDPGKIELVCPICGSKMIKRRATKGANAGNEFYGCSRFPNCKGIISITTS